MSQAGRTIAPGASQRVPQRQYVEDFFVYELDVAGLAPAGISNNNIQIDADSDFKLLKLAGFADVAKAGQTNSSRVLPLVTMTFTDGGSGRNLFSAAVPWPSIIGTGDLPFILPVPRIFTARSSININFTNYDAAQTYNLHLALIGNKIFQQG